MSIWAVQSVCSSIKPPVPRTMWPTRRSNASVAVLLAVPTSHSFKYNHQTAPLFIRTLTLPSSLCIILAVKMRPKGIKTSRFVRMLMLSHSFSESPASTQYLQSRFAFAFNFGSHFHPTGAFTCNTYLSLNLSISLIRFSRRWTRIHKVWNGPSDRDLRPHLQGCVCVRRFRGDHGRPGRETSNEVLPGGCPFVVAQ